MIMKIGNMKISALVSGIILTVLGALLMAEGVITTLDNPSFIFVENMNRGFELMVGFITVIIAGITMDLSRS